MNTHNLINTVWRSQEFIPLVNAEVVHTSSLLTHQRVSAMTCVHDLNVTASFDMSSHSLPLNLSLSPPLLAKASSCSKFDAD